MFPIQQNLVLQSYLLCVFVCPTVVAELLLPSVRSSSVALFPCCGQCLVPILLVDQYVATLGHN